MKDSQGRHYDGWAIKRSSGLLDNYWFARTKTEILDKFQMANESRAAGRRRLKRWGFTIVKVRFEEVEE